MNSRGGQGDQLLDLAGIQAHGAGQRIHARARPREGIEGTVAQDLHADLGQDPERRAMDRLDVIRRKDLDRTERVPEPAPGHLRDAAADPSRASAMGFGAGLDGHGRMLRGPARDSHAGLRCRALTDAMTSSAHGGRLPGIRMRGAPMKLKLAAVVVLGAIGAGAILYTTGVIGVSAATPTEYLTSPATVGDVTDEIAATGTIQPEERTGITFGTDPWTVTDDATPPTAPATYPVTEVKVKVGDTVAKDDVLATADTAALKRALTTAKNDLLSAEVSLRAAEDGLDDASGTAAKRQAKITRYNALNQVATAKQAVKDAQAQVDAATLTAPVAGLVTEVNVVAGSDAPSGAAVVIDSATYKVTTDVVESDLSDVKLGQAADVTVSAVDADVTGTVTEISPHGQRRQRLGRRVLPGHGHHHERAGDGPLRDERGRDDHHGQRDRAS